MYGHILQTPPFCIIISSLYKQGKEIMGCHATSAQFYWRQIFNIKTKKIVARRATIFSMLIFVKLFLKSLQGEWGQRPHGLNNP